MEEYFFSIRGVCLLAAVLSLVLIGAGCGSDDSATGADDVTVETGSLSKAEFVAQANAICAKYKEQLFGEVAVFLEQQQKNPAKPSEGTRPEEKVVLESIVPSFQNQVDGISALGAPAGSEQEVTAFLRSFQRVVNHAEEDPATFARGEGDLGAISKLGKQAGLTACTEPLSN